MAVLSPEAVNTDEPSAKNSADVKYFACPAQVCMHLLVGVPQILAVLSNEAVNTDEPSGEKHCTQHTFAYSDQVCTPSPVEKLQILAELSNEAVNTDEPWGRVYSKDPSTDTGTAIRRARSSMLSCMFPFHPVIMDCNCSSFSIICMEDASYERFCLSSFREKTTQALAGTRTIDASASRYGHPHRYTCQISALFGG